jgi:hypothetical protein
MDGQEAILSPVMNVEGVEGTDSDILVVCLSSYSGPFHRNCFFPDFLIHSILTDYYMAIVIPWVSQSDIRNRNCLPFESTGVHF